MKIIKQSKSGMSAAIASLQAALAAEEPDDIAAALAAAGMEIQTAIVGMDGVFKGFRRDVETTAKKLAARVQSA